VVPVQILRLEVGWYLEGVAVKHDGRGFVQTARVLPQLDPNSYLSVGDSLAGIGLRMVI
jgi:hypothetical protein